MEADRLDRDGDCGDFGSRVLIDSETATEFILHHFWCKM
jgi:hypothetical protein